MLFLGDSFRHTNSTCRTHNAAKVTTYALGANESGLTRSTVKDNSLMTAVATRHLTASATHAELLVELRIDDDVAIQMVGLQELL